MQTLSQRHPDLMLPVKVVPLTKGKFAIVDPEDYEAVSAYKWYAQPAKRTWYARRDPKPGFVHMHTFLTGFTVTDHINRNGLDNRRVNLRDSTTTLNNRNRRIPRNNSSGYVGVSFHKVARKWDSYVYRNRKTIHLGYYDTPEEAHQVREDYINNTQWREVE